MKGKELIQKIKKTGLENETISVNFSYNGNSAHVFDILDVYTECTDRNLFIYIGKIDEVFPKDTKTVYEFWHNPDIFDSVSRCVSLHRTERGAQKAMELHKKKERKIWDKMYKDEEPEMIPFQFGEDKEWGVRERKIFD